MLQFSVISVHHKSMSEMTFLFCNSHSIASTLSYTSDFVCVKTDGDIMVNVFAKGESASRLKERYYEEQRIYGETVFKLIRTIDNSEFFLGRDFVIFILKV